MQNLKEIGIFEPLGEEGNRAYVIKFISQQIYLITSKI